MALGPPAAHRFEVDFARALRVEEAEKSEVLARRINLRKRNKVEGANGPTPLDAVV
jgi:hypothetical protein